jgi:hypothetical protein
MQINRLNLIFPPNTPEAAKPGADGARTASAGVSAAPVRKAAVVAEPAAPVSAPAAAPGVTLALDSGQKAVASGVYTRDGLVAGRVSLALDQTPAEQFVASAVNTLRDFDIGKAGMGYPSTSRTEDAVALPASRFGSFKQAVAKLNVFA